MGVLVALIGLATDWWMILFALFFVGLFLTPVQAAASTLMQQNVPNEKRGRAGSALAGVLGDLIGIRQVSFLSGGNTIIAAFVAAFVAAFLMRETVPAPVAEPA